MNYNKKIIFVVEKGGGYDPELGEHVPSVSILDRERVNLTDLGTDRSKTLFGDINEGAKVIRLLRPYNKSWDYVVIDGKTYELTTQRDTRLRDGIIVQEVTR